MECLLYGSFVLGGWDWSLSKRSGLPGFELTGLTGFYVFRFQDDSDFGVFAVYNKIS